MSVEATIKELEKREKELMVEVKKSPDNVFELATKAKGIQGDLNNLRRVEKRLKNKWYN